jgi:hypothetical protein
MEQKLGHRPRQTDTRDTEGKPNGREKGMKNLENFKIHPGKQINKMLKERHPKRVIKMGTTG